MIVTLLSKKDEWSLKAGALATAALGDRLRWIRGARGEPFPDALDAGSSVLVSFLSPWIVPADVLSRHAVAINFHPASTDYPGIGCYNFALYEGAKTYGAVCHHMAPRVDSGAIVDERRFAVTDTDSVETLKLRTMVVMLSMFHDVIYTIAAGAPLPSASTTWTRKPFTRKQLDALCVLTPDMPPEEMARRIRAVTYPRFPGAELHVNGQVFKAPVPDRAPLA
jgi:methionyl-tRNA formyltransferase